MACRKACVNLGTLKPTVCQGGLDRVLAHLAETDVREVAEPGGSDTDNLNR
jgi:hypothetical protein